MSAHACINKDSTTRRHHRIDHASARVAGTNWFCNIVTSFHSTRVAGQVGDFLDTHVGEVSYDVRDLGALSTLGPSSSDCLPERETSVRHAGY